MTLEIEKPMTIEVTLERYRMFSSTAIVTFSIESEDYESAIDQISRAVRYFTGKFKHQLAEI